jgi:flagellar basal-body rod protein FlgG
MLPAYTRAVSGMQTAQTALDINANNIANANTPGFDPSDPTLQDLTYQDTNPRDLVVANSTTLQGVGATVEATPRSGKFGSPVLTNNPLNVAIGGDGYLQVRQADGTAAYTRAGALQLDGQGRFTIAGLLVQPPVTVPAGATDPAILANGQVTATVGGKTQTIGQLQLTRFPNAEGLQAINNTLYTATATTGTPITGTPGQNGFGGLVVGALEASRVDLSREMANLIIGERAFSLNAHALQTVDAMIGDVTKH